MFKCKYCSEIIEVDGKRNATCSCTQTVVVKDSYLGYQSWAKEEWKQWKDISKKAKKETSQW